MTRDEYIKELEGALGALPQEERERTIAYYEELIDDRTESGADEAEVIAQLEAPQTVAERLLAETAGEMGQSAQTIARAEDYRTASAGETDPTFASQSRQKKPLSAGVIVLLILGSPLWLSLLLAVLAVVLAIGATMWALVFSLAVTVLALGIAGIAAVFSFCIAGLFGGGAAFFLLGLGIAAVGLSLLLVYPTLLLIKLAAKATVEPIKAMYKAILKR